VSRGIGGRRETALLSHPKNPSRSDSLPFATAAQVASAVDSMMAEMLLKEAAARRAEEADENADERQAEAQARREQEWQRRAHW
jgi:hypothetical protein